MKSLSFPTRTRSALATCLLSLACALAPSTATAGKYKASAIIIATLPQYCYAQYIDGLEHDPRFQIRDCGAYSNHFCPGLVGIEQARKSKDPDEKKELLRMARENVNYWANHSRVDDYPKCILRQEGEVKTRLIDQMINSIRRQR